MGIGTVMLASGDRAAATAAIKALLRVQSNGEEALIGGLADVAMGLAESFIGTVLIARGAALGLAADWAGLPAPIRQGVAMLAAHLFDDRYGTKPVPVAVTALWRPYRAMRLKVPA